MIEFITHPVFLWILLSLAVSGLFVWMLSYFIASYFAYTLTLQRKTKEQWGSELPDDLSEDSRKMYEMGAEWAQKNALFKKDLHIVHNGLNLYGEYYDLGYDKTVIILSGRTENRRYGYYFAIPYATYGCNVVVLDPRAHGESDGEFNTVGFEESRDLIAWINHLRESCGVTNIVLHGICIGSAGGVLALTAKDRPSDIDAIVAEGMFARFSESVKNHLIEKKRPVFITLGLIDKWMIHYTGHSMKRGPINVIDQMDTPLLMLHSKEDRYSTPEYARKLFELAKSPQKRLVWFEHGKHSMLRITDTERYDRAIAEFLDQVYSTNNFHTNKEEHYVL